MSPPFEASPDTIVAGHAERNLVGGVAACPLTLPPRVVNVNAYGLAAEIELKVLPREVAEPANEELRKTEHQL